MPAKFKFQEGEQILCFHGPLLYEAKCLKCEVKDKIVKYLVHYNGWSKNWDEWVPETRVLKFNEAGQQKRKELLKAHAVKPKPSKVKDKDKDKDKEKEKEKDVTMKDKPEGEGSKPKPSTSKTSKSDKKTETVVSESKTTVVSDQSEKLDVSSESSKKKRLRQPENVSSEGPKKKKAKLDISNVESEDNYLAKIEVQIKLPKDLKAWLADDWDLVTRQRQLVQLPCKMTVDMILDDYMNERSTSSKNFDKDVYEEVCNGLKEYFNSMLSNQLLYKFERPQYSEIVTNHPDTLPSQIYGASHLMRMFVRIGGLLAYTFQDSKSLQWLLEHFQDFLQYLSTNFGLLFNANDYIAAPPEHIKKIL